jgi:DNA-binding beta-propeller fold protein YncE
MTLDERLGTGRRPNLTVLLLAALSASALAVGCAAPRAIADGFVWPPPPEKGRIKHVRTIVGSADFETSFLARVKRFVLGADHAHDVRHPTSLALSADEKRLYVSSGPSGRVLAFDFADETVRFVATAAGHVPVAPFGVALDANDNVYVTDQAQRKVLVYSRSDDYLREFGRDLLVRPSGIAVDRKRQAVYVCDSGTRDNPRHVIEVFALDGRHLKTIGKRGVGPGEFEYPAYVRVAPNGNIVVTDSINSRVQILDPEGVFVNQFGSLGDGPAQFGKPKGTAFDSFGNIYVVDGQVALVQLLNSNYQSLMGFGGQADIPGFFLMPTDVAVNSRNEIFVADYTGKINQYQLFDTTAEDAFKRSAEPAAPAAPAAPAPAADGAAAPNQGSR